MSGDERQSAPVIRARFAIDGDVIDFLQAHFSFIETKFDRLGRQPGPVLDPTKTFLFGRGNEFAIDKQACRRVAVERVKAQDLHAKESAVTGEQSAGQMREQRNTPIIFRC